MCACLVHEAPRVVPKREARHACAAAGAGSGVAGGARAGPRHVRRAAVARLEPRAHALVERPDVVVALQREAVVAHAVEPLVRGDPPQPAGVRAARRERAHRAAPQHRGVVRHAVAALAGALLLHDACVCAARAHPGSPLHAFCPPLVQHRTLPQAGATPVFDFCISMREPSTLRRAPRGAMWCSTAGSVRPYWGWGCAPSGEHVREMPYDLSVPINSLGAPAGCL
jgi:hypothetical protein